MSIERCIWIEKWKSKNDKDWIRTKFHTKVRERGRYDFYRDLVPKAKVFIIQIMAVKREYIPKPINALNLIQTSPCAVRGDHEVAVKLQNCLFRWKKALRICRWFFLSENIQPMRQARSFSSMFSIFYR
jgi:hypothetical protein